MRVRRYFIEDVPEGGDPKIHGYAGAWHGVWLDENTLFGVFDGATPRVDKLENGDEPSIVILPSLMDTGDVHAHLKGLGKDKHSDTLALTMNAPDVATARSMTNVKARGSVGAPKAVNTYQVAMKIGKLFGHPHFKPSF